MTTSIQQSRAALKTLAEELLSLSDTFEPSESSWGLEPPIVAKAKAIIAVAQSPAEHAMGMAISGLEVAALHNLIYLKAIDSIPTTGSISITNLSTSTKADSALLKRLFRPFVGNGFILQDSAGNYSHTPLSQSYRSTEMAGVVFTCCFENGTDIITRLPDYLELKSRRDDTPGICRYAEPGSREDNSLHNPWNWRFNSEGKSGYEIMNAKPELMQRMHLLLGSIAHLNPFVGFYDFSKLALPLPPSSSSPPRAVFVDIGGGYGPAIAQILAAHPEIHPEQCVLQDLEPVIRDVENGVKAGGASTTGGGSGKPLPPPLPKSVRKQIHSYFSPQPLVGARAYHLRACAHNLSDSNLLRVISLIKPAMLADSKLLIADNVIPDRGMKGLSGYMDLMMMAIGGKERTEEEFREILGEAGLKVDGVHWAGGEGRNYAIVEASLMDQSQGK